MFGGTKLRLDKDLINRLRRISDTAGYATVEEFVTHILEKELQHFEGSDSNEDIEAKLRGLGYIS